MVKAMDQRSEFLSMFARYLCETLEAEPQMPPAAELTDEQHLLRVTRRVWRGKHPPWLKWPRNISG